MIGSIILVILGVFVLIGAGNQALKDFNIPSIAAVALLALIIGLNFIPTVDIGFITFNVGTLLLYALCLLMFIMRGKASNQFMSFLITLILAGLIYGSTRIALLFDNSFWGRVNVFYALIVGVLAMVFTRNAKYSFISSITAILIASLLTQIGTKLSLNASYDWSIVAASTAVVLFSIVTRMVPSKPNRMSYYFEAGRMLDE